MTAYQPQRYVPVTHYPETDWVNGIFSCCDSSENFESCVCSMFCPCLVAYSTADAAGGSGLVACACTFFVCRPLVHGYYRSEFRKELGIEPGDIIEDVFWHCCCSSCALAQERNEFRTRTEFYTGVPVAPPPQQYMEPGAPPMWQQQTAGPMMYTPPVAETVPNVPPMSNCENSRPAIPDQSVYVSAPVYHDSLSPPHTPAEKAYHQ